MKGKSDCLFSGGPNGDEELVLPAMHCRNRLSLEQEGWIKAGPDGSALVMKERRPDGANWLSYTTAVYEKAPRSNDRRLVYQFLRLDIVERCGHVLELKGRRCKHETLPGENFCRQHLPNQ